VGAGVEPGVAAAHDLHVERSPFEVLAVDVGDFEFAAHAGLEVPGDVDDAVVVEVEAGDGVATLGHSGLFFEADGTAILVEFDDAVAFGVVHRVGEDGGTFGFQGGAAQAAGQVVAVEEVVAEDQGAGAVADEVLADDEGLGEAVGAGLDGVLQVEAPLVAVAQQLLEARGVLRGGDDEDVADARQHEGAQRVVDHRFVVHRDELLGDGQGGGVQPGAGAAGEDDAFALHGLGFLQFVRISVSMRSTPCSQAGSVRPKASRNLAVARRELAGRCAGVGKALVGTGRMASAATWTGIPLARANSMTWRA
jgi:hypothetical protein